MKSGNRHSRDTTGRNGFQHSVLLLEGITSWHLWSSVMVMVLVPVTIAMLSFPLLLARLSLFEKHDPTLLVRVLLGMMWAVIAFSLYYQRRRLKAVRLGLISQVDRAIKSNVRAEEFYGLSILDPLTGLFNRRFGETRLEDEIAKAHKSGDPLLVLAIDFDRFKEINDKFGHSAGDMALQEFSRRLQRAIRACDVPIRAGGDEFFVVLPDCPPEKVRLILSRMGSIAFTLDGTQIPVSFSYGMAQCQASDTLETIMKRADERLYAAKAKSKTAIEVELTTTRKAEPEMKPSEYYSIEPSLPQLVTSTRPGRVRRGSRVPKEIAVRLIGTDLEGKFFSEQTNTVELSQHGAGVVSRQKLAPGQEMIIRRQETNKEAEVRVVRIIGSQSGSHTYGVALVNSTINIWGIEFPPMSESEKEASLLLFECSDCESRVIVGNRDIESNGFAVNKAVVGSCKRCGSATTWNRVLGDDAGIGVTEMVEVLACAVSV
jgi:diguanylate cyclase (GGDEF)-like protein